MCNHIEDILIIFIMHVLSIKKEEDLSFIDNDGRLSFLFSLQFVNSKADQD